MTIFVDASALVSIMNGEEDAMTLSESLQGDPVRITSAVALWETSRAIARHRKNSLMEGFLEAERYCAALQIVVVPIGQVEARDAVTAQATYGKGTGHKAALNMGDCFAYACAKTNRAQLLYKGNDFAQTDLA